MRVLIVGAGPTGTALAFLLARRGIEVVLLEREIGFDRVFRGEALMPSGVDAIGQMGLGQEFDRLPQRIVECMEFFVEGTRVLRADWSEVAGPNSVRLVSQPALLKMLVDAARKYPSFELRMGSTVRDLAFKPDWIEAQVHSSLGNETVSADVLVGTDGRSSLVRTRINGMFDRLPFPFDVVWFSAPIPPFQQEDPRFQGFSRAGRSAALYPSWDDRMRIGINIPSSDSSHLAGASKKQLLLELASVVGERYASFFLGSLKCVSEPVILKILFGRCQRWWATRTLLLGDAAHPMSPIRAQGINLALRDAIVAANHLVPALQSDDLDAFNRAAQKIQQEREPEIVESQRLQTLTAQPPPPARSAVLRKTVLPVLSYLGVVKYLFLRTELPMRQGIISVQLTA